MVRRARSGCGCAACSRDRPDLELLEIDPRFRKDSSARAELLNSADVSILCLPDAAAREAVAAIANPNARVIDGSTAHRVEPGLGVWACPSYAQGQRAAIASAARVSNPGCYPTCVSLLLRPLVDAELLAPDAPLAIHALSGYSGGGQSMIDRWESAEFGLRALPFEAPYALDRRHKHVPGDDALWTALPGAAVRARGRPVPLRHARARSRCPRACLARAPRPRRSTTPCARAMPTSRA